MIKTGVKAGVKTGNIDPLMNIDRLDKDIKEVITDAIELGKDIIENDSSFKSMNEEQKSQLLLKLRLSITNEINKDKIENPSLAFDQEYQKKVSNQVKMLTMFWRPNRDNLMGYLQKRIGSGKTIDDLLFDMNYGLVEAVGKEKHDESKSQLSTFVNERETKYGREFLNEFGLNSTVRVRIKKIKEGLGENCSIDDILYSYNDKYKNKIISEGREINKAIDVITKEKLLSYLDFSEVEDVEDGFGHGRLGASVKLDPIGHVENNDILNLMLKEVLKIDKNPEFIKCIKNIIKENDNLNIPITLETVYYVKYYIYYKMLGKTDSNISKFYS